MRLLLLSNSTIPGQNYMEWAMHFLGDFLGQDIRSIAFVPFAGVTVDWDAYEQKVKEVFNHFDCLVTSVHKVKDPVSLIETTDAIAVGGGNTFKLVHDLHQSGLMKVIRQKVLEGKPYMGWSAGSNIACPTLRTTNDMPIIQPWSFDTLNLVPFQINPHYLDISPAGHGGETREDRIREFIELNRKIYVVGLREGTLLEVDGNSMKMKGEKTARIFRFGHDAYELGSSEDFSFLIS